MIKRILVALDPDEDTPVAVRYAAELAQRCAAEVSGLAVVNTRKIAAEIGPGGAVGGQYYAEQSRQRLTDRAWETARELLEAFEFHLNEAHVRHEEHVEEGVPLKRVIAEMKVHDLLIVGSASHFYYTRPDQETNTLAKIVKQGIIPTLVVGEAYRAIRRVLVAYDGSDASARTMQRFAQLRPFGTEVDIELVHIRSADGRDARNESDLMLYRAGTFLRAHGFALVTSTSRNGGAPGDQLLEHAVHTEADLIVAGAHSVSAMRRIAFGSTTHTLLSHCPVPFFLFH